ncbi:accessory gene regulator B family protein [Clostridium sp. JN-1]|uniref:accessory gene regulator ArgB-like protein n=1 Tax=Clostridium sp. JN-1 TaxID=2483110 RepID=UPI000F0B31BF|nr:accessory gene regulator B family protein [Clostridium sp. JN-1]
MNINFIQKFSNAFGSKLASTLKLDKDGRDIIVYGALNLFQMIWSILWVIVLGAVFHVAGQAILVCASTAILRKYSGGAHAPSSNSCAVIGAVISAGIALIVSKVFIKVSFLTVIFIEVISLGISYYLIYKHAPVDSRAKKITSAEARQKFKKYSILTLNIFTLIIIILDICYTKYNNSTYFLIIVQCMCMGTLWQAFTLTSIAHKLFNIINIFKFRGEGLR